MTKSEVFEYLKDNLRLAIESGFPTHGGTYTGFKSNTFEVKLYLKDPDGKEELVTSDQFTVESYEP
jgi:hypothetical protein